YINVQFSVALIVISLVYLFAKSLFMLLNSLSKLKTAINYYTLKEALDGLKTAVMFESEFNVVYENLAMKNLLEKLDINKKQSSLEIWKNLKSRQGSKIVDEQNILVFLDERVYSFSIIKQSKIQIIAFNITEEYLTTLEIENKQVELKVKQFEILKLIKNLDKIEREKEVLRLKSKLHDIIGQRLFILHNVLDIIDEKTFDLNNIKNMLKTMIGEIDNDEDFETKNMQNSIITAFEMIGFNIVISGQMPREIQTAKALINIIRECATNAIRHANATKLFVNISNDKIEIFDNGKFANQTIIEGTGIKGMRLNAEMLCGELFISNDNGFKVVIEMKKTNYKTN
ncbi:MAG: sensor histidine kinase, partial [Christensenellales bacterium]